MIWFQNLRLKLRLRPKKTPLVDLCSLCVLCTKSENSSFVLTKIVMYTILLHLLFGMLCEAFQMRLFFSLQPVDIWRVFCCQPFEILSQSGNSPWKSEIYLNWPSFKHTHMEIGWKMSKFETLDFLTRLSWVSKY